MVYPDLRYTEHGVPVLRRSEIDSIAIRILMDFDKHLLDKPVPVNVDMLAESYMQLHTDFQFLSHDGFIMGSMIFEDYNLIVYDPEKKEAKYCPEKKDTIVIDSRLSDEKHENRYRFTMGHEIGHAFLHKPYFRYLGSHAEEPAAPISCRTDHRTSGQEPGREWSDLDWLEWQADCFASAILMPRLMVKKCRDQFWDTFRTEPPQIKFDPIIFNNVLTEEVAAAFQVSKVAARTRLEKLGFLRKVPRGWLEDCSPGIVTPTGVFD